MLFLGLFIPGSIYVWEFVFGFTDRGSGAGVWGLECRVDWAWGIFEAALPREPTDNAERDQRNEHLPNPSHSQNESQGKDSRPVPTRGEPPTRDNKTKF